MNRLVRLCGLCISFVPSKQHPTVIGYCEFVHAIRDYDKKALACFEPNVARKSADEGGVRRFFVEARDGAWWPVCEAGANRNASNEEAHE